MTEQETHINGRTVSVSICYKRCSTGTRGGGLVFARRTKSTVATRGSAQTCPLEVGRPPLQLLTSSWTSCLAGVSSSRELSRMMKGLVASLRWSCQTQPMIPPAAW